MKQNAYKVLIISCWVLLAIALVIKLFGSNLFNIIVENESFISFCNYVDKSWLKYLVATIIYIPTTYLLYLSTIKEKIGKDLFILIVELPISFLKIKIPVLGVIMEMSILIFIPLIRTKLKCWKNVIFIHIVIIGYELVTLLLRNLGLYIDSTSILVSIIVSVDYYIIIMIYYVYATRKLEKGE